MGVSLTKGEAVSLTKLADDAGGKLTTVQIGLGWDARSTDGAPFDLDASAFVLGADGKVLSPKHFVFFNNLSTPDGNVTHTGDNLTGAGDGDDETIIAKLADLPPEADKLVIAVTIHMAAERKQKFGDVRNPYVHIVDENGSELTKFDLGEELSIETAAIFCELYRYNGEWKFRAIGQGYSNGLAGLCADHGVPLG